MRFVERGGIFGLVVRETPECATVIWPDAAAPTEHDPKTLRDATRTEWVRARMTPWRSPRPTRTTTARPSAGAL